MSEKSLAEADVTVFSMTSGLLDKTPALLVKAGNLDVALELLERRLFD